MQPHQALGANIAGHMIQLSFPKGWEQRSTSERVAIVRQSLKERIGAISSNAPKFKSLAAGEAEDCVARVLKIGLNKRNHTALILSLGFLAGLNVGLSKGERFSFAAVWLAAYVYFFRHTPGSIAANFYQSLNRVSLSVFYGQRRSIFDLIDGLECLETTSKPGQNAINAQKEVIDWALTSWTKELVRQGQGISQLPEDVLTQVMKEYFAIQELLTCLPVDYVTKRAELYKTSSPDFEHHQLEDYRSAIVCLLREVADKIPKIRFVLPADRAALRNDAYDNVSLLAWLLGRVPQLKKTTLDSNPNQAAS